MQLSSDKNGSTLTVSVSGKVDTNTAPELENYITENTGDISELILDLKDMTYTSSAGLRVLLKAHKLLNGKGAMKVVNVQSDVMEILDMTGFSDILNIE